MALLKSTSVIGNLSATGNIIASKFILNGGDNDSLLLAGGNTKLISDFATSDQMTAANTSINNLFSGKVSKAGDTMTGLLKTVFKQSVAVGSYEAAAKTIPDLIAEVRYSNGCMGSVSITTAYINGNITIPATWYNFLYIPHRTGSSGDPSNPANGDNCNYGTLFLMGMTGNDGYYRIRFSNNNIAEVERIISSAGGSIYGSLSVSGNITPSLNNSIALGTSNLKWSNVYATTFTGNLSGNASTATIADKVKGSYTSSGGQQNPNYFGTNKVGFLMMNTSVNSNTQYKDWIIMDCYSGNDVGGGVAFGVNRQSLGAYIMRSAKERTEWSESAELVLLSTGNSTANYIPKFTAANTIGNGWQIQNFIGVQGLGYISDSQAAGLIPSLCALAYWNGAYGSGTSATASNLSYCNQGKFGSIVTKSSSDYLPIGGGTMTGDILFSNSGTTFRQIRGTVGDNDYWRVGGGATASNGGYMEIATSDDGNEPIYVRQYTGVYTTLTRTLTLLDADGSTSFPGTVKFANGTWNIVGDDSMFGDQNVAGAFCIKGNNGATTLRMYSYDSAVTTTANFQYNTSDKCIDVIFN